jgi:hypothetical protein
MALSVKMISEYWNGIGHGLIFVYVGFYLEGHNEPAETLRLKSVP